MINTEKQNMKLMMLSFLHYFLLSSGLYFQYEQTSMDFNGAFSKDEKSARTRLVSQQNNFRSVFSNPSFRVETGRKL